MISKKLPKNNNVSKINRKNHVFWNCVFSIIINMNIWFRIFIFLLYNLINFNVNTALFHPFEIRKTFQCSFVEIELWLTKTHTRCQPKKGRKGIKLAAQYTKNRVCVFAATLGVDRKTYHQPTKYSGVMVSGRPSRWLVFGLRTKAHHLGL